MAVLLAVRRYFLSKGDGASWTKKPKFILYAEKICQELFENERNRLPIRSIGAYGWDTLRNAFIGAIAIDLRHGMSPISEAVIFREKFTG